MRKKAYNFRSDNTLMSLRDEKIEFPSPDDWIRSSSVQLVYFSVFASKREIPNERKGICNFDFVDKDVMARFSAKP